MKKIVIDPSIRLTFSSYYIKGLEDVFGGKNISFSSKYFHALERKFDSDSYDQYLAFVYFNDLSSTYNKIIIDFRDDSSINEKAYGWCDVYAKVNYNKDVTDSNHIEKIVSIPPGFGIKFWGFWRTCFFCYINLLRCKFSPLVSIKYFFIDYFYPYFKRSRIDSYYKETGIENYKIDSKSNVFFISTLWTHTNCVRGTNLFRKRFVECCSIKDHIVFEGGFYALRSNPHYNEYKKFVFTTRYQIEKYIQKTKLSSFVFNTPAVHNCHGWKLGEYLAMGKAIISTPLSNELPEKLSHGVNIHIVDDIDELEAAIDLLSRDNDYRKLLENGAKQYYLKNCEPSVLINNILGHLKL